MAEDKSYPPNLTFVTSNSNKAMEVKKILGEYDIRFEHLDMKYVEIQSSSLQEIAVSSAKCLCDDVKNPFFVEDAGLFIDALGGFPGPYSSYALKTIGNSGILKLMDGIGKRTSRFESVVAYAKSIQEINVFQGIVEGSICTEAAGEGWGFDPIFIPQGSSQTYAEMGVEKQRISHRRIAFVKLAAWIKTHPRQSSFARPSG